MSGVHSLKLRPLAKCTTADLRQQARLHERRRFGQLVAELGSQEDVARALGVSTDSIQRWTTTNPVRATELPAWAVRALRELAGAPSSRTGT